LKGNALDGANIGVDGLGALADFFHGEHDIGHHFTALAGRLAGAA